MVVRRAAPGDVAALLALVAQYWAFEGLRGFQSADLQAPLARLLSSPALGAVWLAGDTRQPAGYLILVYVFSLEHRGMTSEIDEFFVAPGRRGSGAGARLLAAAEAESLARGCTNISLQVSGSNLRAREFYRRHGYSARSGYQLLEKDLGAA